MTEMAGYERPGFFGNGNRSKEITYSYGPQSWFDDTKAECLATESSVTMFDQSCYVKFRVEGRDACRILNHVSAGNVDVRAGKVVYTQWLNSRGGIEADVTITRLSETEFLVVTIAASQSRDMAWLKRNTPDDAHVVVTDITPGLPMLALMGPKSRDLLEKLSGSDLSNDAFPFGTSREIEIGYGSVRASRLTFVGELGWELYIPADLATHVFDRIVEVGAEFDLGHAGFFALNSLRMEKGYRHWGHDIGEEDTPRQAGLSFAVDYEKLEFIGRDALLAERDRGIPTKRLVQFRLPEGCRDMLYHEEPIWKDGDIVGSITSGGFGHRLDRSLGMGYVNCADGVSKAFLESNEFEIEIACERIPSEPSLQPFLDPKNLRIKV